MSSKNIFEVLQNIAENTESTEKFLNILKENGFTGTLEEAENQINQQTQVVLNNLTTEDLQNIAGGKSLMNDKLKKAIAVGGASLMAAGTVMPSSLAANKSALTYVKKHPVHTGVTSTFVLTTAALLAHTIFNGTPKSSTGTRKTESDGNHTQLTMTKLLPFLKCTDQSADKTGSEFVEHLCTDGYKFDVTNSSNRVEIKFTEDATNTLAKALYNTGTPKALTIDELTLEVLAAMDNGEKYYGNSDGLKEDAVDFAKALRDLIAETLVACAAKTKSACQDEASRKEADQRLDLLKQAKDAATELKTSSKKQA